MVHSEKSFASFSSRKVRGLTQRGKSLKIRAGPVVGPTKLLFWCGKRPRVSCPLWDGELGAFSMDTKNKTLSNGAVN